MESSEQENSSSEMDSSEVPTGYVSPKLVFQITPNFKLFESNFESC